MEQKLSAVLRKYNYIEDGIAEQYRLMAGAMGLSESAFNILYVLYEEGDGCSQKAIYKMSGMSRKTAGSSLKKLQDEGFLVLQKDDAARGNRVFLTEAGKVLMEEKVAPIVQAEDRVYASWSEEDRQKMLSLCGRYLEQITEEFRKIQAELENAKD